MYIKAKVNIIMDKKMPTVPVIMPASALPWPPFGLPIKPHIRAAMPRGIDINHIKQLSIDKIPSTRLAIDIPLEGCFGIA